MQNLRYKSRSLSKSERVLPDGRQSFRTDILIFVLTQTRSELHDYVGNKFCFNSAPFLIDHNDVPSQRLTRIHNATPLTRTRGPYL